MKTIMLGNLDITSDPASPCCLSRDGRQASELLSNAVSSAVKTGNGLYLFNPFIYLFIDSTEDDAS